MQSHISELRRIDGYGISHMNLDAGLTLDQAVGGGKMLSVDPPDCNSGGEGSTSCSITGCSVTVGTGYYACCYTDETGAHCVAVENP